LPHFAVLLTPQLLLQWYRLEGQTHVRARAVGEQSRASLLQQRASRYADWRDAMRLVV
jgi:hypothetical protein